MTGLIGHIDRENRLPLTFPRRSSKMHLHGVKARKHIPGKLNMVASWLVHRRDVWEMCQGYRSLGAIKQ
jgi:hypothetical protein